MSQSEINDQFTCHQCGSINCYITEDMKSPPIGIMIFKKANGGMVEPLTNESGLAQVFKAGSISLYTQLKNLNDINDGHRYFGLRIQDPLGYLLK